MLYAFDPSGVSGANKITGENHAVSPPKTIGDISFIVPRITPFFAAGLIVKLGSRVLTEGVDYILIFHHLSLSAHLSKPIFGGIAFRNPEFTGSVTIDYQTVGGDFQLGDLDILEKLSRRMGSIHYVTFDQIAGTPSSYPPDNHYHDWETGIADMGDVVDAIELMTAEIGKNPGSLSELSVKVDAHLNAPNAHTKASVGLGQVQNLATAAVVDILAGGRKLYVTADVLSQYIRDNVLNKISVGGGGSITQATIDEINGAIRQINLNVAGLERNVNSLGSLSNTVNQLQITVNGLAKPLTNAEIVLLIKNELNNVEDNSSYIAQLNKRIDELSARIDKLPVGGGGDGGMGGTLVAKTVFDITSKKVFWNSGSVNATARVSTTEGLALTVVTSPVECGYGSCRFDIKLPTTYDPALHRINIIGAGYYAVNDITKVVQINLASTSSESYEYEVGDEGRTGTRYYVDTTFSVEMFTK